MVYRGQPSKSCRQCRKRDIKCDKQQDACGQCIRANLACPGYHNPSKIVFANETESVIRKALRRVRVPKPSTTLLVPCLEDRAKSLFVSEYIYCRTAQFPYIEHFWLPRPQHVHLAACLRAVSLAFLSLALRSSEILQRARQQYSHALYLTNIALQHPDSAKHNATILTVLLMSMYEKLTHHLVSDSSEESKHIDGAIALLQLSDASQFEDAIRLQLFRQVSMRVFLRCLGRGDDIPADFLALRQSIQTTDRDGYLEELIERFVILRGGLRKGELSEREMRAEVIKLDEALIQICSTLPKWKFVDALDGQVDNKDFFLHLIESSSMA